MAIDVHNGRYTNSVSGTINKKCGRAKQKPFKVTKKELTDLVLSLKRD